MLARFTLASSTLFILFPALDCVRAQVPVIGSWAFDETTGFLANDSGPAANHGTLLNFVATPSPWVAGVHGNALSFDGIDDYVELHPIGGMPCFRGFGETFSICLWINGTPTDDDRVVCFGSSTSNTPLFSLGTGSATLGNADKLRLYVRNAENVASARYSAATVFDNTWHHIAYVECSGAARLYVDGVLDQTNFDNRYGINGTRSPTLGTYGFDKIALGAVLRPSICCYYLGAIDDLRIYRSVLAQQDVVAVMNGGVPPFVRASIGEYGQGCGPGPFEMWASGQAVLGGSGLYLALRGGRPSASALLGLGVGAITPLDLSALGFPGCKLLPANASFLAIGALDASGSLPLVPFSIPNLPGLAGLDAVFQAIEVGAGGGDLTNAVVAVLGS